MSGLAIFAEQFPSFLLSVFGGVVADRYNRYKIINITQITSMMQATLLAVLIITHHYSVGAILALSAILGIINAFDIPARQTMINEMLNDKADLPNAISLNSGMASLSRIGGPVLAGFILKNFGAEICFLVNAASFGAVIISFMLMKIPPHAPASHKKQNAIREFVDGFTYLKKTPSIGLIVLLLSIISFLILPYDTLLPAFAEKIFKGGSGTFGAIRGFVGVGAFCGTIFLASLKQGVNLRKILLLSIVILSVGLISFSHTTYFPLAMAFAVITGLGSVAQFTVANIIVQSESADYIRGRAISILLMAMFGMLPVGSLLVGAVSKKISEPNIMLYQGIIALIIAAIFYRLYRRIRL
jgi:MFS family permease